MIKELTTQEVSACYGGVRMVEATIGSGEAGMVAVIVEGLGSCLLFSIFKPDTIFKQIATGFLVSILTIVAYRNVIGLKWKEERSR
jgi:hypothetical protein